jgi:hypothetical protein
MAGRPMVSAPQGRAFNRWATLGMVEIVLDLDGSPCHTTVWVARWQSSCSWSLQ